ncbi:protein phosphatase 2c, putative [Ichthyophthirius multifiliis]|uniref:protein-serine/threonine phosphatase n=1 Tax=Ichthyophthirius multifiliis TaxID=5932 RepID=G0QX61_ICHMU|nr:protein phosphatase 2c, putative [Ichthyophthirius multifiliis]EGR30192.1 protein phosphatase 2c, putative [Ichthyophthirius multifiliis]|eukprot:XP_004031788.1 protein phosphatase 2c, putative [Ichthyophthirius multifiliis]
MTVFLQSQIQINHNLVKIKQQPKCSFFCVYNGHNGVNYADFLKYNLHQYVIQQSSFPQNPIDALIQGFDQCEQAFSQLDLNNANQIDRSGSCALVLLIVGEIIYVANVGDSRPVLSVKFGQKVSSLLKDHKPDQEYEKNRILQAGGRIYYQSKFILFFY